MSHPQLDLTRLTFPSDRLTFHAIRSVHPHLFAQEAPAFFEDGLRNADVSGMFEVERALAVRAFESALGIRDTDRESGESRQQMIEALTESYQRYGLSSGQEHTLQIVRDFEAAAATQAQHGRGPA